MDIVLSSVERDIVETIRDFLPGPCPGILELGMGRGNHTRLLRAAWPEARILGYDLFRMWMKDRPDWHSPAVDLVDGERYEDITLLSHPEEKGTFDVVTLGNYRSRVAQMFALETEEQYARLIESMTFYLKPGGSILLVLKNGKTETQAQKNCRDLADFKYGCHVEELTELQKNCAISEMTREILLRLDYRDFREILLPDREPVSEGTNWSEGAVEFLQKNGLETPERITRAAEIDTNIRKSGQHRGYISIISALKS